MKKREDVVMYGFGNVGKSLFFYIKNQFNLLYIIDGDNQLWNTKYNGIDIYPPEMIIGYKGKVIVTTTESFFVEILESLKKKGIDESRIFRGQHRYYDQKEEIIPCNQKWLCPDEIELSYCDLLHNKESNCECNVMVLCAFYSSYVVQLVKNCKKRLPHISFSILSNSKKYANDVSEYADHIYVYHSYAELKGILKKLPKYFVFQMLWIENTWVYFRELIRKKCDKLNLCVGGSDLYRANKSECIYKEKLIRIADNISAENDRTIEDFLRVYPEVRSKICFANFGIEGLDYLRKYDGLSKRILKHKLGFPKDKIIVACGYNANPAHQHCQIIKALNEMKESDKNRIFLLFLMTYPDNQEVYISMVNNELRKTHIDYAIIKDYMQAKEMSKYEICTDILITMQTTDQLSSTMLENMYCGNIVIAGAWLPYEMLRNKGINYLSINRFDELPQLLAEVVANKESYNLWCSKNKDKVYDISSWDNVVEKWRKLWE